MTTPVLVTEYDLSWPLFFKRLSDIIWPHVAEFAISIEHVGSTSVPGLAAKPVIDIDIVVASPNDVTRAVGNLREIGYIHRGNLGIEGREAFTNPPSDVSHNLYVCLMDCVSLRNHLALRDSLRKDTTLRNGYSELKKALAAKFPNSIDDYIEGKTAFIVEVLRSNGFREGELGAIGLANTSPKKSCT